jgi:hypothetical protein
MTALKNKNIATTDADRLEEFRADMRYLCEPMSRSAYDSVKDCTAAQTVTQRKK